MRPQDLELLTILLQRIDVQIKKYFALSQIGVGPDADMNAHLVSDEVDELLEGFDRLLASIGREGLEPVAYNKMLRQVTFYTDLEFLRGQAAELIDSGNIHNVLHGRVQEQRRKLYELYECLERKEENLFETKAMVQQQCEHDSYAIAHLILESARTLMDNPEAEIQANLPLHALSIMRRHAREDGDRRYHDPHIKAAIDSLYKECSAFMAQSTLQKSTKLLSQDEASQKMLTDREKFTYSLARLNRLVPEGQWQKIVWDQIGFAKTKEWAPPPRESKLQALQARCSSGFFCKAAKVAVAVGMVAVAATAFTYR